jgi:phytoene desaturase
VSTRHAAVIGGGLGGVAVALRLAAAGWRVSVCESGPTFGGKMNRWSAAGFTFDTGPSLITMPWVFSDLFAAAGSRMADHLELVRMEPLATYVFDDGTRFEYGSSIPQLLSTIGQIEPRDVDGFWRFLHLGARIFELSKETFFRRGAFEPPDRAALRALRRMPLRHAWGNYHAVVARHFRSPYLRQLYDRYPTYVGSSPYSAPATLAIIPYIELAFGGWYVRGGLYRIVQGLVDLCGARGVELRANARVASIVRANGRAAGVTLEDGETLPADIVIMNGDTADIPGLLKEPGATRLPAAERSLSGFVLLLGVRKALPGVAHHAVYFSADYDREFGDLFDRRIFPQDPTVYVNVPSRTDRSVVPGGEGETLFVMANAPADDDPWTEARIEGATARVLARLRRGGFPEIESDVVVRETWTPTRLASSYAAPGGAIYGTHSHGWRHAFMRPPNKDTRVSGLYYVGGSTHPGGGTPTVLMSAQITSDLIARHEKS